MHGMRGMSEVQKTQGYFSLNDFLHSDAPRTRRSKTPTTFYPLKKARNPVIVIIPLNFACYTLPTHINCSELLLTP